MPAKKVVYLIGAGGSMAEAQYAGVHDDLSLRGVSERIITQALEDPDINDLLEGVSTDDIKDIERYISLLEDSHIQKYDRLARSLRSSFCSDIISHLKIRGTPIIPTLTMALLELHNIEEVKNTEVLQGIITLNYDSLLDFSMNQILGGVNYGVSCICECGSFNINLEKIPLLKLHGAFNWNRGFPQIIIDESTVENQEDKIWIPPGIAKDRERYPFDILWGKAYELLNCKVLRSIGCSLSLNDWGLTSLLYKTQLRTNVDDKYTIELINRHKSGMRKRENHGYLDNMKPFGELEGCSEYVDEDPENTFETWIMRKANMFVESGIEIEGNPNLEKILGETD